MKLIIKMLHAIMKINAFEINFNVTLKKSLKNVFLFSFSKWQLRHYEIKWNYETNHFKLSIEL